MKEDFVEKHYLNGLAQGIKQNPQKTLIDASVQKCQRHFSGENNIRASRIC